jgi:BirA family biotin operon repressor/biotin-[acetyl-CoA-carboxylase] ligase
MDYSPDAHVREWRGWILHDCETLVSTNDYARQLPPWSAVRAVRQTDGRGRHGRRWSSAGGGLWTSVVLPLEPAGQGWSAFPLAAGLAVVSTLKGLGLHHARLRWPNDVLIGPRKICGILMEKFSPEKFVVGLGLNVTNDPADDDPSLAPIATSLAEELSEPPSLDQVYEDILTALRVLHSRVAEDGFASLTDDINNQWGGNREVEVHLSGEKTRGRFLGIDSRGDLLLDIDRRTVTFSAPHVQLMREV